MCVLISILFDLKHLGVKKMKKIRKVQILFHTTKHDGTEAFDGVFYTPAIIKFKDPLFFCYNLSLHCLVYGIKFNVSDLLRCRATKSQRHLLLKICNVLYQTSSAFNEMSFKV